MSLNTKYDIFILSLSLASLVGHRMSESKRNIFDYILFWFSAILMILFAAFRPLGVGVDDLGAAPSGEYLGGYADGQYGFPCPTLECGRLIQGSRDQVWYSAVGLLKSIYPDAQVVLWLSGFGLWLKCWVISRLCTNRSLALVFYASAFYIIHDITALRVSLAISFYLFSFFLLVRGHSVKGALLLLSDGFFHRQAFAAPLLLLGHWTSTRPKATVFLLLLPLVLLTMAAYPGDAVLTWLMGNQYGIKFVHTLFNGNEFHKLSGGYDHTRIWPVVAPPTLLLAAWLIFDLWPADQVLFRYSSASLLLAAWLLWGYAVIPEVQLRFWDFFLVPIVFFIGNAHLTGRKLLAIFALSAMYALKYSVIHDLLLDQRQVHLDKTVGGHITLLTPAITCGKECGFNITKGSIAKIQATPDQGYRFDAWSGACEGTDSLCELTVEESATISAQFVKTVAVSFQVTGAGIISSDGQGLCSNFCYLQSDVSSELRLMAQPAEGWRFEGWGESCEGTDLLCVLKPEADKMVSAKFVQIHALH